MQDQFNPYQAPLSAAMHPRAEEWLRTSDASLQKVAAGLGLIYMGLVVLLATIVIGGVIGGIMGARGELARAAPPQEFGMIALAIGGGALLGYVLNLIGTLRCMATPEESGAKGLINATAALMVVSLLMILFNFFAESPIVGVVQRLVSLIGGVTFVIYLRRLAEFIGSERLARKARTILILLAVGVVLLVVIIAALVVAFAEFPVHGGGGPPSLAIAAGVASLVLLIGGLITFVMYANLINAMRKVIQQGREYD